MSRLAARIAAAEHKLSRRSILPFDLSALSDDELDGMISVLEYWRGERAEPPSEEEVELACDGCRRLDNSAEDFRALGVPASVYLNTLREHWPRIPVPQQYRDLSDEELEARIDAHRREIVTWPDRVGAPIAREAS